VAHKGRKKKLMITKVRYSFEWYVNDCIVFLMSYKKHLIEVITVVFWFWQDKVKKNCTVAWVHTKLNFSTNQLMTMVATLKGHMNFRCLNADLHKDKQIIQGRLSFAALKQSSPRFLGQLVDLRVHMQSIGVVYHGKEGVRGNRPTLLNPAQFWPRPYPCSLVKG